MQVRIVVDKKRNINKPSRAATDLVTCSGVEFRTNDHVHILHDKTIIVDGKTMETGSAEYDAAARMIGESLLLPLASELSGKLCGCRRHPYHQPSPHGHWNLYGSAFRILLTFPSAPVHQWNSAAGASTAFRVQAAGLLVENDKVRAGKPAPHLTVPTAELLELKHVDQVESEEYLLAVDDAPACAHRVAVKPQELHAS